MNRRDFFGNGVLLGAGALLYNSCESAKSELFATEGAPCKETRLRLSCQMNVAPGATEEEKLANMKKYGCEAVEYHGNVVGKGAEYKKLADKHGLEVSVICWGSFKGALCKEDKSSIATLRDAMKRALETAGELQARGIIYVPAFKSETNLTNQEIRARCLDFLPEMGEFAVQHKTKIILEPLCRLEAFFLRQVADGAAIARDCGGPDHGIGVMGDFYHMDLEETSDMGAFISGGSSLSHVHLAGGKTEPRRKLPGQNSRSFVDGFRGLKYIGYKGFCSFECGCVGDPKVEIPKSIDFLRRSWDEA